MFCIWLGKISPFSVLTVEKYKNLEKKKTFNKRVFINADLILVFLARFPEPAFLPLEHKKKAFGSMHGILSTPELTTLTARPEH